MTKKSIILPPEYFKEYTPRLAQNLLGKVLYRQQDSLLFRAIISETEAYHGPEDLACHCSKGYTPRTKIMYKEAGHIYVYLIYGMYYMLNFVTMEKNFPAAVLVRGIKNLQVSYNHGKSFEPVAAPTNGPGKLTKQLKLDKSLNGLKLHRKNGLWVANEQIKIYKNQIQNGPRIGVNYAKEWAKKPWRYWI